MLSKEDNALLTQVGPGSLMGDLLRQYWLPALLSSELPGGDCPPVRIRLLGESLVAFRDTAGRVGLLDHACPHRGASLFFGRNEECGLRCVYHGWKFDVAGRCVDMPNEPAESTFKDRIRATAYPCEERNGVVWAYLGPRAVPPPLPGLEGNLLPDGTWLVSAIMRECNWVQALEGDIDTSHLGFLHLGGIPAEIATPGTFSQYLLANKAPRFQLVDTDYGLMSGAYRPADEERYYWRIAQFLFPCFTMPPVGPLGLRIGARAWVPMDDDHTLFFMMRSQDPPRPASANGHPIEAASAHPMLNETSFRSPSTLPNTTGWYGRFRLAADRSNDYGIDRARQRAGDYTGIEGIFLQDQCVTESMGSVIDRRNERLGSSDMAVIRVRQRLLAAARSLRERGVAPPGVDDPAAYGVRSGGMVLSREADWVSAARALGRGFVEHPEIDTSILGNIPGA